MTEATASLPAAPDAAAEAYAVLFARRYLTWSAAEPQASASALEPFLGPSMEAGAGLVLPAGGEQQVEWAEVVQAREPTPGTHVYTVAAQTDTAGLLYLTVAVERDRGRRARAGGLSGVRRARRRPAPRSFLRHLREVSEPVAGDGRAARAAQLPRRAQRASSRPTSRTARASRFRGMPLTLDSCSAWTGRRGRTRCSHVVRPRTRAALATRSPTNSTCCASRGAGRSRLYRRTPMPRHRLEEKR